MKTLPRKLHENLTNQKEKTKKKRLSSVDTAENLRDGQDEETLMNLTSGT